MDRKDFTVTDCRARPDTKEFLAALDSPELMNDMRKLKRTPPTISRTLDECIDFFKREGVSRIVCIGRDMGSSGGVSVDNAYIASIAAQKPEHIIGIAGIDPLRGNAVENIRHAIIDLHLKGISMDPAFMDMYADDKRLYPIYQTCMELNIPVFLTLGPRPFGHGTKMCYCNPLPVDNVAADFPKLRLLISHGGFPWMQEMIAIAFRNDNVWFETSAYWFMPGVSSLIVEAANSILTEKICFGSAYPFEPVGETISKLLSLPFKKEVLSYMFNENINRLLEG